MSDTESTIQYLTKLRRLWKGTLYIGIVALYVAIVGASLVMVGWLTGLLALGLIGLSQLFRYIASEVDRIGWVLRTENDEEAHIEQTSSLKRRLFALLTFLVQLPNVALVAHIYTNVLLIWSGVLIVALVVIELLFQEIRRVNRQVAYREASYGFEDRTLPTPGQKSSATQLGQDAVLKDRLNRLEQLVDEGKITREAYEKARDKYWIRHIMNARE